jgi:hypothetical protein
MRNRQKMRVCVVFVHFVDKGYLAHTLKNANFAPIKQIHKKNIYANLHRKRQYLY